MLRYLVASLRSIAASSLLVIPVAAQSAPSGISTTVPGLLAGPQYPSIGQSFLTSRGPAFVTGRTGSLATTTIPGSGAQGFLMNNGNGTSTLIVPGGVPQVLATPR
jgi:hypothetical protein